MELGLGALAQKVNLKFPDSTCDKAPTTEIKSREVCKQYCEHQPRGGIQKAALPVFH